VANFSIYTLAVKKKYFERVAMATQAGKKQLWQFLFPEMDSDLSSDFLLDQLIANTYGVTYRTRDMQSNVREYQAGKGTLITPPRASEKTPITEKLRDSVVAGMEGSATAQEQSAKLFDNIAKQHISAFNMTKNKQALDVFRLGEFVAKGKDGSDLDLDIDFGRASATEKTYDFTAVGATYSEAMSELKTASLDAGSVGDVMFAILGKEWLDKRRTDTALNEWNKANPLVSFNETTNAPAELQNIEGVRIVGCDHIDGESQGIWILAYNPGTKYREYEGASATEFVPVNVALFGSVGDIRYTVERGVDALDSNEQAVRAVGEIVFDSFTQKDPVGTFVRGQSRHCFVPGDANTTAVSVGTFA